MLADSSHRLDLNHEFAADDLGLRRELQTWELFEMTRIYHRLEITQNVIALFTKVGAGTFSLIIIIIIFIFSKILPDVQCPKDPTDLLENYSVVVVERSTFE
jgi:hypothetical protein